MGKAYIEFSVLHCFRYSLGVLGHGSRDKGPTTVTLNAQVLLRDTLLERSLACWAIANNLFFVLHI